MNRILKWPVIRDLHHRSLLFPVIVLLAVAGILLQGALHREPPAEAATNPEFSPPPAPVALPALRPDVDKAPLSYASDYWSQLGERARTRMILAGDERVTGVTIAPGFAFTSLRVAYGIRERQRVRDTMRAKSGGETAAPNPLRAQSEDDEFERLIGVDLDLGLALIAMKQPYAARPFPFGESVLRAGAWIAAVSLTPEGRVEVTPGHLAINPMNGEITPLASVLDAAIAFPESTEISAVVDLDGGLLGVAVMGHGGPRVLSLDTVLASLERLRSNQPCRAITTAGISEQAATLLGIEFGALVAAVRKESFPAEPTLLAGDILLEWNGERVYGAEQFELLYDAAGSGRSVTFTALRGNRRVTGSMPVPDASCLPMTPPPVTFPSLGLYLDWAGEDAGQRSWKVAAVAPHTPAARAGVLAGDRIIAVNSEELSERTRSRALDAYERQPRPMLFSIDRGGQITLATVTPEQRPR